MSREQVKTIRLEHSHGALFDYSVKGKEVDHIRFSQAERSVVYVTVVFADRTEWSISIEPFSLPTARVAERGHSAIIYDPACEFIRQFYSPERGDIVLNPLDARCPFWSPSAELKRKAEAKALAVSLFQPGGNTLKFFVESPQKIFAHLLSYLPSPSDLVHWMSHPEEIDRRVKDTELAALIDPKAPQQRTGVLGSQDRVLLIGDTRQHQGVEAGCPFEQLQEAGMRTARLDEIVRQKNPALKSAVELLATGQSSAALEALQQQGRVCEIPDSQDRIRTIARLYAESPANTLIVSPDNASRRELNLAVREELKAGGAVSEHDHSFRILVQRQDMTGADRAWANHYEQGDVIRFARGSKSLGIEAGSYAKVAAIEPSHNLLAVQRESGETVTYDPRRLAGVSVYREAMYDFAVGDRIQFTAPDKQLAVANRDLAVIETIEPNGRIGAQLDDNRHIEFDAGEYRHYDYGYAVTSHSAQGLTAERVLIHADTGVHPDLLSARFGYVAVSRASHEATIFTDDVAKLSPQLATDVSKESALEVTQGASIAQAIGVGIEI